MTSNKQELRFLQPSSFMPSITLIRLKHNSGIRKEDIRVLPEGEGGVKVSLQYRVFLVSEVGTVV